MTLLSWLPAGAPDETVPAGQEGLTAERLAAYTATSPSDTDQLLLSFYATAATAFPIEIDAGIGIGIGISGSIDEAYALIRPEGGPLTLNRPAQPIDRDVETTEIVAGDEVMPGETVRVDDLQGATLQGPTDGTPAGYTIVFVSPVSADAQSVSTPELDTPASETQTSARPESLGVDYLGYDVPLPSNDEFLAELGRYAMEPGSTLTRFFSDVSPTTVANFVAEGSVTLTFQGAVPLDLVGGSDAAFGSITGTGILTVAPGPEGAVLYQTAPGSNISESYETGVSVRGGVGVEYLGSYVDAASLDESVLFGTGSGTADVSFGLGRMQDGGSQPFGDPSAVTIVTPIDGDISVVPGTGQLLRSNNQINGPPTDPEIVERETIGVGSGVTIQPGGQFRVKWNGQPVRYLILTISAIPADMSSVDGTPAADTTSEGTPVPRTSSTVACDITPWTIDELLALYDEGVASPVDPFTLGHREDAGTGTPANDETAAGITYTLLRLAACQGADEQLQSFALYSDEALRAVLPLIFQTREELVRVPEQEASQTTGGPSRDVSVSDIEVFSDGRVGARVALDSEFAYVTFIQLPNGTWVIDLFDDSEQQGG